MIILTQIWACDVCGNISSETIQPHWGDDAEVAPPHSEDWEARVFGEVNYDVCPDCCAARRAAIESRDNDATLRLVLREKAITAYTQGVESDSRFILTVADGDSRSFPLLRDGSVPNGMVALEGRAFKMRALVPLKAGSIERGYILMA